MCILRELQRENAINIMLIVTRYFGGIQLHTDRFKNVIDACKIFFEKEKKK
jgi:putative IMPACT (imprinted ancient) family translation regulator